MKKLLGILVLGLLSISAPCYADDISDFQMEGISIGDSLLNHLSKEEIITEIEINKPAYNYLTEDFGEVYLFSKFEIYDVVSFFVKPNDKKYLIYYIGGTIYYDNNIKECYIKQKEIFKELSSQYKSTREEKSTFIFPWDSTGKSKVYTLSLFFNSEDRISIACAEFEKSQKIKRGFKDGLTVEISKKEHTAWMLNKIN